MRLHIIVPVFNDWESFQVLLLEIDRVCSRIDARVSVAAINDGSTTTSPDIKELMRNKISLYSIELIELMCNLGHQRAIAIGLAEVIEREDIDAIVVMDSDGEDAPRYIPKLIEGYISNNDSFIVSSRWKRKESATFKMFYAIYKFIFKLMTGSVIDFGNYCLIPIQLARRIVFMPDCWNHLAASIIKSKCPILKIKTERGDRYHGKSKMNFVSLVTHGLSAISAFLDNVFVRIFIICSFVSVVLLVSIFAIVFIRIYTSLAVPGWSSTLSILCLVLLAQVSIFAIGAAFINLATRTSRGFVPAIDSRSFVKDRVAIVNVRMR